MLRVVWKVVGVFSSECRQRGMYYALLMMLSHLAGVWRGLLYTVLYFRTLKSSLFAMQAGSSIEIFNKKAKVTIGKFVFIRKNASFRVDGNGELTIGDKVFINDNCTIHCVHMVSIGEYTKIAPNVSIYDHDHNYDGRTGGHLLKGEVVIGKHVWIGSNVVILRNTVIGDHCVIAAGSIVKGVVEPGTLLWNKREIKLRTLAEHSGEPAVSRKKNVLISAYDMEIGGIERSLLHMLENFDYDNYNVDLLLFRHSGELMSLIPRQVNVLPQMKHLTAFRKPIGDCIREGQLVAAIVRIVCKYAAVAKGRSRKLKEGPGYIQMQLIAKYLTQLMPKLDGAYDYAISYAWPHDAVAHKVRAHRKIAWIHTDYSELEIDNEMDSRIWSRFDHIASISEACTSSFVGKYPKLRKKIVHIENINSPNLIQQLAETEEPLHEIEGRTEEVFTIVSVGRLSYVKGFDMAVEALKKLHDKGYTNIKWYVVGYGGYESTLREIIAANQLQDSFILLGKKVNPYPYIKACDLYVQPSRYEGKAVTVTEAKILHKPILITNYPTARSQVEDGVDGIICEMSVDGIVKGIEDLYGNPNVRDMLTHCLQAKDYRNSAELNKLYTIMA